MPNLYLIGQKCGTDAYIEHLKATNPTFLQKREAVEQSILEATKNSPIQLRESFVIPVVVHIVYRTEEQNISDQQVYSQLASLNDDFRAKNPNRTEVDDEFSSQIADVGFEFCLADTDPFGMPTTGITRTETTLQNIGSQYGTSNQRSIFYDQHGGKTGWSPNEYLNIWVCEIGNNILGFSSFPGAPVREDGVVIHFTNFGSLGTAKAPNHLGKTLSHEIGHFFDLYHIWGNTQSCLSDDGISDTPEQQNPTSGCPTSKQVSCNTFDMYYNYMDYSNDPCLAMFTYEQKEKMVATLEVYRNSLKQSSRCTIEQIDNPLSILTVKNNPSSGEVTVSIDKGGVFQATISLVDVWGRILFDEDPVFFPGEYTFNIQSYPMGVYFLIIRTSIGTEVKKITLMH